jgi:hypothetical protein
MRSVAKNFRDRQFRRNIGRNEYVRASLGAALATVAALGSAPALAKDNEARISAGVTAGTLGIGPEFGYRLSENIGIRANATFFSFSHDIHSDDIKYDADLKLRSGGAMIDVYPFGGGFRISGGLRVNGNKARGTGRPNDGSSYTIGGTTYSAADIGTLHAATDINKVAPALTLGYGGGMARGLTFGIEAGALFQGRVKVKPLTVTGLCADTSIGPCAALAADLEAERQSVNDDIDDYKVYPVLQLTLGYKF